jgi:hypothetical protein
VLHYINTYYKDRNLSCITRALYSLCSRFLKRLQAMPLATNRQKQVKKHEDGSDEA